MLMEPAYQLTADFISAATTTLGAAGAPRSKPHEVKRDKPKEFLSFLFDLARTDGCLNLEGRTNLVKARSRVADHLDRHGAKMRQRGLRDNHAAVDIMQGKRLDITGISGVCAVFDINCILLFEHVALKLHWPEEAQQTPRKWLVLQHAGKHLYHRAKDLTEAYVNDNYVLITDPAKGIGPISKNTAGEFRRIYTLCGFGTPSPKTKRAVYDAIDAYIRRVLKTGN